MAEKQDKVARIDRFYAEQLAYFLRKLDALKDPDSPRGEGRGQQREA